MSLTHADLVARAARWLRSKRCAVVMAEPTNVSNEVPDAIGWNRHGFSILVECKTSRSDFLRDKNKIVRQCGTGMGQHKYYLAPLGIIAPDDLPSDWGLLVLSGRGVRVAAHPGEQSALGSLRALRNEIGVLVARMWKLEHPEANEPFKLMRTGIRGGRLQELSWYIKPGSLEVA